MTISKSSGALVALVVVVTLVGAFALDAQTRNETTSTTVISANGTLVALINIGPTRPVCSANSSVVPGPSDYIPIGVVVSSSGRNITTLPVNWLSNGCEVFGSIQVSLAPRAYSLNLSTCTFMGCKSALPESFNISSNQETSVHVSIDTGIR